MRNVEQAGGSARGVVLGDDRAVLDRHRPARKLDHAAAVGRVPIKQRRLRQHAGHPGVVLSFPEERVAQLAP